MSARQLALHADDLGMNHAVNDGILRGFREGLLTSTSLLANAPDAADALMHWKSLAADRAAGGLPSRDVRKQLGDPESDFDLGVHLNLTQGRPLGGDRYPAELLDSAGRFPGVFALFARLWRSGNKFQAAIRDEWQRQIEVVCDHDLRPTHLNGHQYVEMLPIAADIVPELMQRFGIKSVRVACEPGLLRNTVLHRFGAAKWPLAQVKHLFAAKFRRLVDARGIAHTDAFFGTAHAGSVDLQLLARFLAAARTCQSVEVGLHPGETAMTISPAAPSDGWSDPLVQMRPRELAMLTSQELPRLLDASGCRLGRLQLTGR
jgi:chitin disaccharide deacetylase